MLAIATRSIAILFVVCITTSRSLGQEKIETDRPDQTESPYTVPKKFFQFEFGFNVEKDKSYGVTTTNFVRPTTLLKYGVNENFELRAEFQSYTSRSVFNNVKQSSNSFEPLELGFKAKLFEEKGIIPKAAFLFHTTIPTVASKEFRQLNPAPRFRFLLQNTLSDTWALGYNIGMEWDGFTTVPTYAYTFAPGFTINDKWAGYVEVYGFLKKDETPEHAIDGGIYYFPNNNMKLDISAGYGLTKVATDFYIALGLSFRFKP